VLSKMGEQKLISSLFSRISRKEQSTSISKFLTTFMNVECQLSRGLNTLEHPRRDFPWGL
jgi:hypothetical protein